MWRRSSLLVLAAIGCARPDPPEHGGFVTRLGNDTIGVERFTRTRDSIVGEFLFRTPQTSRQRYVVRTTPDGAVTLYSIQLYESAKPGAKKTYRYDADFRGDSVHIMRFGGGPSRRMRTMPKLPVLKIEITWTVIPLLLMLGVYAWASEVYFDEQRPPDHAPTLQKTPAVLPHRTVMRPQHNGEC